MNKIEIINIYGSIDNFREIFPNYYNRFTEKEEIMIDSISKENDNFIMVVSPIFSASIIENILFTNYLSIDTLESIYNRLIIEEDNTLDYKETVSAIKEAHGDYVLALKKNQKTFYDDVKDYLVDLGILKEIEKENYAEYIEKSHSKIITRKYYMTSKISWLENKEKWEKLKSIGVEKKTIESIQTGKVIEENRYFIISFKDDIHSFADAVRKHWGVENNLHAPLDIVFKEDANRTLEKNGAKNLGILKRICLAVLKFVQTYYNLSLNKIRFLLSIDFEKEIENVFKLLNTNDIAKLLEKNT